MSHHFHCKRALVWFRRDLRDYDHAALAAALRAASEVFCVFIFDRDILDALPTRRDRRVHFIHASLIELDAALRARGGRMMVFDGRAIEEIPRVAGELRVQAVFANRDYEPAAKRRDAAVETALAKQGIAFIPHKDQAIFDGDEVLTVAGKPYSVFTPYSRAWRKRLAAEGAAPLDASGLLASAQANAMPTLADLGFVSTDLNIAGLQPGMSGANKTWEEFKERLEAYGETRDFPAVRGTSLLSVHLRFGTLSVRQLVGHAFACMGRGAEIWLSELIWRDFYFQILDYFPEVAATAFKAQYDALRWDDWPEAFDAWRDGRTGFPLVDAAMRQLKVSGNMHNRLRMVTASFLCKDLGIDWRLGERHFAEHLNDFDLSANNGGWQWSASTGCDAQPWFRVFNPVTQSERFDPKGDFIRRFVPELANVPDRHIHAPWRMDRLQQEACGIVVGLDYPQPVIDHEKARRRPGARFAALKKRVSA